MMRTNLTGLAVALACATLAGCATMQPRQEYSVSLTGTQIVPPPGHDSGTGTARARLETGTSRFCWDMTVRGIGTTRAAALNRGAAGLVGQAVAPLATPDAAGRSAGCVTLEPDLYQEVAAAPERFHISVATAQFPTGAVRGQLRRMGVI